MFNYRHRNNGGRSHKSCEKLQISRWRTSQKKGKEMVERARTYKNVILHTRSQQLDNTVAMSALWQNIAIPSIMYAADAVPIPESTISELEVIQNKIGKSLLGVTQSSANTVVQVELGWMPIRLLIELNKLCFLLRAPSLSKVPWLNLALCGTLVTRRPYTTPTSCPFWVNMLHPSKT